MSDQHCILITKTDQYMNTVKHTGEEKKRKPSAKGGFSLLA